MFAEYLIMEGSQRDTAAHVLAAANTKATID